MNTVGPGRCPPPFVTGTDCSARSEPAARCPRRGGTGAPSPRSAPRWYSSPRPSCSPSSSACARAASRTSPGSAAATPRTAGPRRTAAPPPHPLLVFTEVDGEYGPFPDHHQGTASDQPPPESVELVGCGRLTDDPPRTPLTTCHYGPPPQPITSTNQIRVYQGRYQVDVYEVRTGHQVTSFPLDGQADRGCGDVAYFEHGEKSRDHYTRPSPVAYQTRLASLVRRYAGP